MTSDKYSPAVGLDIGTMNLVAARQVGEEVETKRVRDAFIDLDAEAKRTLRLSKVSYVEKDGHLVVLGDSALNMANLFKREVRRPLAKGVISAGELDAQQILSLLISNVVGEPSVEGEHCFYSVPAAPVDDEGQDIIYHTEVFRKILTELGYTAHPMNEAMGIIYSQCAAETFSGLAVSFGSGMCNIALSYQAMMGLDFSLARCLSETFPVLTDRGVKPITDVIPGEDKVLDGNGEWSSVLELVDNGPRESLLEVRLKNLTTLPIQMTPDHRVFVRDRFGWSWKEASTLTVGDMVGVPTVKSEYTSGNSYYFGRKNGQNVTVATARNLGRFFGMFLGDGSCGPYSEDSEFVQLAINSKHAGTVEKYVTVLNELFGGFRDKVGGLGVEVSSGDDNVTRVKLHSTVIARHMKEKFYQNGEKSLPLPLHKVSNQMALGVLEGLFDSDGWSEPKRRSFGNTSLSLIATVHHLLNRFGIKHSISKRLPRQGGVNSRGVQIEGRKDEYVVRVGGRVSSTLLDELLRAEGNQIWDNFPDFVEYQVASTSEVVYSGNVYDLKVDSPHHSFSTFGMLVHNCGDWIDFHAAKATGSTASRMCAIKEKGVDLANPKNRDEEAIALYIRSLIKYCLEHISKQFKKVQSNVDLPEPVPFIVSGGTSRAEGFLDLFTEEFEAIKKKGFPIEISEIRAATDPMTAVAEGLLVLAVEEHADDED